MINHGVNCGCCLRWEKDELKPNHVQEDNMVLCWICLGTCSVYSNNELPIKLPCPCCKGSGLVQEGFSVEDKNGANQ